MNWDQLIFDTAIEDGMPERLALFIVAQARHETGNYTHRFFTDYKNAFGYAWVAGNDVWQLPDPGTTADNGWPIARYGSVDRSVHELTSWIKRRQQEGKFPADLSQITTAEQYSSLLKSAGYYGASLATYTAGILRALENIGELVVRSKGAAIGLIIVLAVIFRKQLFWVK